MSKRFTFKSVLTLVVILLSALVLVACGDNDQDAVDTAVTGLALPFQGSDSATNVTQNLTLPTTVGDVTITWASSHPTVITTAGVVSRPAFGQADVTVTLTATLTKGDATGEKQFTLVVKAMAQTDQQAVTAAIASLDITLQTGNTAATVTGNITLPTTVGTTTVAWSSSNQAVVSNAGVVTRPAAGLNNAVVTLTATVTKGAATGTKTFTVTVLAHPVIVTDQDAVNEALNVLNIGLAAGNTLANITANVTLPATQNTLDVVWSSNNAAVVSNAGVVTRPGKGMSPVTVTLTAEISKGIAFGSKTFTLTVQPEPYTVDDVVEAIAITGDTITYNADTNRYTTTTNIVLPTNIFGIAIVWSSPNPAVITAEGVVTRPAYGQNDSTVILTATILEEDFTFIVTVPAITVKPVSLILSEAYDSLLLAGIANGVATDLTLPTVVGTEGVTVTWASNNTNVITNLGVVTRQPEHTTVVLTATLHLSGQQLTKEFEVVVLRFADFHEVANLQEAIEWFQTGVSPDPEVPINYYVKIPGVTIFGRTTEGFMFGDATGMSFAYTASAPNLNWIVGNVYDFYGLADFFNGNIQFNGVKEVSKPIQMLPSTAEVTVLTPTVVTDIEAYIASLPTVYADKSTPLVHQYIQLTAKVRYQSSDNYHTMFVNPSYDGPDINTAAQSPFTTNALIVYYKSNKADLVPFNGLTVTVNVFLYSLRNDRNLYTVIYTGTQDDIQTSLDDAGIIDVVKTSLQSSYASEYDVPTTLTLPTFMLGSSIVWSTPSPYVNVTTGAVTMPAEGQETVTLTATITRGDATTTATIVFLVGELPLSTVQQARDAVLDSKVRIQGTISSVSFDTSDRAVLFMQDVTGGIYVYKVAASFKAHLVVGNKIEIVGTVGTFGASPQIINITKVTVVETGLTVTPVVITEPADVVAAQGQLVSITGYLRQNYTGTPSDYHLITDMGTFNLRLVSSSDALAADRTAIINLLVGATPGAQITVIGGAQRNNATYQIMLFYVNLITVGAVGAEADLADAIAANYVPLAGNDSVTADLTLPTTSFVGSTVAWSSSHPAVISDAGVVTRPAIGQPDAVVTMTYTVTIGVTVAVTGTVEFTVLALVDENPAPTIDLYFSEYLEGSSNNKALEIYNPTDSIVDLSTYSVELYSNGSATAGNTLALTGTLAPGAVFVIVNSSAIQAILDKQNVTSTVTFFNGDDALVLKNGSTIIDSFGQVGFDPGTNWSANGVVTSEMTLVRKISVTSGRTDHTSVFDPSLEWIAFPQDTTMYLGWHATDLFFSEYIEGGSSNKALEIFNPTAETVDLSTYTVKLYSNGAPLTGDATQTQVLSGTLAPGAVMIIVNASATAEFKVGTYIESNVTFYNGDDALILLNGDRIVDSIGQVGVDPGTQWSANGVSTLDMTLVRKPGTYRGRTDATSAYDPSLYWIAYPINTSTYLGSHTN